MYLLHPEDCSWENENHAISAPGREVSCFATKGSHKISLEPFENL